MPDRAPASTAPLFAALAVVITWGLNFPLSKALFTQVGPAGFLGLRYLLVPLCAAALLCWRFGLRWPRLDRHEVWPLVRLTLVGQGLHLLLSTYGMQDSTAFSASVLLACGPVFTLLILRLSGVERLSRGQVAGVATAALGALLFTSDKLLTADEEVVALLASDRGKWLTGVNYRVDGGMAVNDWLAQDLADMLELPVERPSDVETRSGAALAPGYVVGTWQVWETLLALALFAGQLRSIDLPPDEAALLSKIERSIAALNELLTHELTHCVMYQRAGTDLNWSLKGIPLWFREGMASVTAGMATWCQPSTVSRPEDQPPHWTTSPRPKLGNQPSCTANTRISRMPIRKVGSDTPSSDSIMKAWLRKVPRRNAA